jgi:hypothetical protein
VWGVSQLKNGRTKTALSLPARRTGVPGLITAGPPQDEKASGPPPDEKLEQELKALARSSGDTLRYLDLAVSIGAMSA